MKFDFEALQKFIDKQTGGKPPLGIEELNKHVHRFMDEKNNNGMPNFEGYSPSDMQQMIHFPFGQSSPVKFRMDDVSLLEKVPVYKLVKYLLEMIGRQGEMKLTVTGNLPVKAVRELYDQSFLPDYWLDKRKIKLIKESDSETITITRILIEITKLVKKRHNKLSLTASGRKLLGDPGELFRILFEAFSYNFNWAYLDGYGMEKAFQMGFVFSFVLVNKYGSRKKPSAFYADKYLNAYPGLLKNIQPRSENDDIRESARRCYSLRTFDRFMYYLGLVKIEKTRPFHDPDNIMASEIFHKIVHVTPPDKRAGFA